MDGRTCRSTLRRGLRHASLGANVHMPGNELARANSSTPGRTSGELGRPAHASPFLGAGSARVLIRLPDLRQPQKCSVWRKWLGFALAVVGGGSLSAAGSLATAGDKSPPSTAISGDSTDTARVARWRMIYQWLQPLLNYSLTHPKTIVSGALAAAAQFAAMVAWNHSGQPADKYPGIEPARVVTTEGEPPTWCPAPRYQVDRRGNSPGPGDYEQESDRGPQIIDPHSRHSGEHRYHEQDHRDRDEDHSPHAALNRPSRLSNCDHDCQETLTDCQGDEGADPTARRVALRHESPRTRPAAGRGVAWLEGNIIPSPTREASHEPAQPRVH